MQEGKGVKCLEENGIATYRFSDSCLPTDDKNIISVDTL